MPDLPFVGRSAEVQRLLAALDAALDGSGRLVLLVGEPGCGKTRLAEDLATRARERGAAVAWGRCWEGEGAPELWPWLQVIRTCLRAVDEPTLRALIGPHGGELTALLAPLRVPSGDDLTPPAAPAARFRLFNAIAHFLDAYARRCPLLLILDDLQRADPPSLLLLQFFTQEQRQRPILVLGTYRMHGAPANRALTEMVVEASREPGTERLEVGAFSRDETAALLRAWFAQEPDADLSSALYDWTGGNLLCLIECLRHLPRDASGAPLASAELPLPAELRVAIEQRLAPLSVEQRAVLRQGAALGAVFQPDALAAAADAAAGAAALQAAEQLGLVQRVGSGGDFRFPQGLVRALLCGEARKATLPLAPRGAPDSVAAAADAALFRKEGEYWTIAYAARTCRIRDAKGLVYIALLLRHPGKPLHVTELVNLGGAADAASESIAAHAEADAPVRRGLGDAGAVLDSQAKTEYRRRLAELQSELQEAQTFHDPGRVERARAEIDMLTHELSAAVGLGGRDRRLGSDAERARVNVTRSITRALEKIAENHPELAEHLGRALRTGTVCTCALVAALPPDWVL